MQNSQKNGGDALQNLVMLGTEKNGACIPLTTYLCSWTAFSCPFHNLMNHVSVGIQLAAAPSAATAAVTNGAAAIAVATMESKGFKS